MLSKQTHNRLNCRQHGQAFTYCEVSMNNLLQLTIKGLYKLHGPETGVSRMRGVGSMVIWVAILLGFSLASSYL